MDSLSNIFIDNHDSGHFILQGRSVSNLQSSLEAMKGSAQSLKEELGTDLLSQLSTEDQAEMDTLTDQIKTLTQQNKDSLKERIKVLNHRYVGQGFF